jgi:hypothetical protein
VQHEKIQDENEWGTDKKPVKGIQENYPVRAILANEEGYKQSFQKCAW